MDFGVTGEYMDNSIKSLTYNSKPGIFTLLTVTIRSFVSCTPDSVLIPSVNTSFLGPVNFHGISRPVYKLPLTPLPLVVILEYCDSQEILNNREKHFYDVRNI